MAAVSVETFRAIDRGSGWVLEGLCEVEDVLALWSVVRQAVPGAWMHNTLCEIHSPESFATAVNHTSEPPNPLL